MHAVGPVERRWPIAATSRPSSMRRLALLTALVAFAGCRSPEPYAPPAVPPDASALVLTDDEVPRVLYASAWGAFARFGWEMEGSAPASLRFTVRPPDASGRLDVHVEEDVEGGRVGTGRLVARAEGPDRRAVLEAAADVLATIPGRIAVR